MRGKVRVDPAKLLFIGSIVEPSMSTLIFFCPRVNSPLPYFAPAIASVTAMALEMGII